MKTQLLPYNKKNVAVAAEVIKTAELSPFPPKPFTVLGQTHSMRARLTKFCGEGASRRQSAHRARLQKSQIEEVACEISADARKIIDKFWPDSLTLVLKKRDSLPPNVTAGLDTVAVRMPASREARGFIRACGVPLAAPSANKSGRPSPTSALQVAEDMDGRLPVILSGRNCRVGIESTVLDLTGDAPVVLRPGIVSAASIERVLSKRVVYLKEDAPSAKLNSPGLRYRHYAPCCEMALNLDGDREKIFARYREAVQAGKNPVLLCGMEREENFEDAETVCLGSTDEECARNLFGALRALEKNTTAS